MSAGIGQIGKDLYNRLRNGYQESDILVWLMSLGMTKEEAERAIKAVKSNKKDYDGLAHSGKKR